MSESNPPEQHLSGVEAEYKDWLQDFELLEPIVPGLERVTIRQKLALVKSLRTAGNSLRARFKANANSVPESLVDEFQKYLSRLDQIESDLRSALISSVPSSMDSTQDLPHRPSRNESVKDEEAIPEVLHLATSQGATDSAFMAIFSALFVVVGLVFIPVAINIFNEPYFTKTQKGSDQTVLYYSADRLPDIGNATYTIAQKVSESDLWREKLPFLVMPFGFIILGSIFLWISVPQAGVETIELDGRELTIRTSFDGLKFQRKYRLRRNAKPRLEVTNYKRGFRVNYEPDSIELPVEGDRYVRIGYGSTKGELDDNLRLISRYLERSLDSTIQ